jgi:hypothetical protein
MKFASAKSNFVKHGTAFMAVLTEGKLKAAEARGRHVQGIEPLAESARFVSQSGRVVNELNNG